MAVVAIFENGIHGSAGNVMLFGNLSHCNGGLLKFLSPSSNLGIGKMGRWMIFAMTRTIRKCRNTLTLIIGILDIVRISSKKQMCRVDTQGIVTTRTIVANKHAVRDRAIMQFPCNARGFCHLLFVMDSCLKLSIAMAIGRSRPQPTIVWTAPVNLLPKTFGNRPVWANLVVVSNNKSNRLAGNMTKFAVALLRNRGRLAATALAEFYRGFGRGMLAHVISSLSASRQAGGVCSVARRLYCTRVL